MFQVPDIFLDKLKCSVCDGYLNAPPVVVKNGKQICAKCYRILPNNEKELCVREISYEAIGSCLIFPCRYHKMGCDYTFAWNSENGHESDCKKRYFSFPDIVGISDDKQAEPNTIMFKNETLLIHSNTGTTNFAFKEGSSEDFNSLDKAKTLAFDNEPTKNSITLARNYENINSIASTISSIPIQTIRCLNCNAKDKRNNTYICPYGHSFCKNCKEDKCVVCIKNLSGPPGIACKNASKGCKDILLQGDVGYHRDNCDFNEISCPMNNCGIKEVYEKLKTHLKNDHADKIILSNEVSKTANRKDETIVFFCYDDIFKALYYHYETTVEIIVVYLGPCEKVSKFSVEVSLELNKQTIKKKLGCANWNNYMLATGLTIDKKELLNTCGKNRNCLINIRIIRTK